MALPEATEPAEHLRSRPAPQADLDRHAPLSNPASAYGRSFWFTYAANCAMMSAVSLHFRYADFIQLLGGDEWNLGLISGTGAVGAVLMRIVQGRSIDRYGARTVWLLSAALFVLGCLGHLLLTTAAGPAPYLLRIVYNTSIAGFFGSSITYTSGRAPMARAAEVVGTLGTSGFLGMILGSWAGDLLTGPLLGLDSARSLRLLFLTAAGLGGLAFNFGILATRGAAPLAGRRMPPLLALVRRYHPGGLLVIAVAMGFGLSIPGLFVRPYFEQIGIPTIGLFFTLYAVVAFVARMSVRGLPARIGARPLALAGTLLTAVAMLSFLCIRDPWTMTIPALVIGVAHALLFPAVVADGACSFPVRYRGLGTTLILTLHDVGVLVAGPFAGGAIKLAERAGWPPYPAMFVAVAGVLVFAALLFIVLPSRRR
jgi:MFS family permease